MKIVLINSDNEGGYLPVATAYIASYLRKYNFKDIIIIDQHKKNINGIIRKNQPDIIGINVFSNTYFKMNKIAGEIKKISKAPIVVGGPHIYCDPFCIKNSNFDIGITGEGEIAFLELIKLLEKEKKIEEKNLRKVKGISFLKNNKNIEITSPADTIKNIDEIPPPAIDLLDMKNHYLVPGPAGSSLIGRRGYLLTSRGCPYKCIYCASGSIWKNVRWHSAERVVSEIKNWINKYKVNHIYVYDDLLIANLPRLKKIIYLLKKEKLLGKVDFEILARANLINEKLCKLLKKLNATTISVGFESGSEKILKSLKGDNVTVKEGNNAISLLHKYNFVVYGLFMIGSPGENEEDLQKTYNMAKDSRIKVLNVNVTMPFVGTKLWDYAIRNKIYPKDFFEKDLEITPTKSNLDYLLTKDISKEKFKEYFDKFVKLSLKKNNSYSPKFKLNDIKFFLDIKFIKKIIKRKKLLKQSIIHLMNSLLKNK